MIVPVFLLHAAKVIKQNDELSSLFCFLHLTYRFFCTYTDLTVMRIFDLEVRIVHLYKSFTIKFHLSSIMKSI